MAKSTAARAASRFRQLSCLGLNPRSVIPELLNELHALIPSHCNTFVFSNGDGVPTNMYLENTDTMKIFPIYQKEYHERRDREFKGKSFSDAARSHFGVQEFKTTVVDAHSYDRSDQYNLIERASGNDANYVRLVFRSGGRVLGGLTMWRSLGAGKWSPEEKRALGALESFFVHALTAHDASEATMVDSGRSGLVIADREGKLVYSSLEGRRLLFYATNANDTLDARMVALPPTLVRLCRDLHRIFSDDASASAPIYHHSNVWGGFTFRAQWLDHDDPASGLIGITVSHKVPLPIKLMRSVQKLPLSRRQAEVCVLIATGASNEKIAERLGISKHTANEHGRWIYNKLDVHNRAELLSKILSG